MKKFALIFALIFGPIIASNAVETPTDLIVGTPTGSLITASTSSPMDLAGILALVQNILVVGIAPVLVVGMALYIAYTLFTADGDAEKLKKAWNAIAYSAVGLIVIALSYVFVRFVGTLSIT